MSGGLNLRAENDHEYVDIHGRDIPAVIIEKTGQVMFPLTELRQTGYGIFKKSQHSKLSTIDDKEFDENFHLYMLESAKKYMLGNKIAFQDHEILNTIHACKNQLTTNKTATPVKPFFKNRHVEEMPDNEIVIQVNVSDPNHVSTPPSFSNVNRRISTPKFPKKSPKELFKDAEKCNSSPKPNDSNTPSHSKFEPGQSKLRFPPSKVLEKVPLREDHIKEHTVMVTCIHKRNCIWVRDKANEELFNKIHVLVNQEAKHQKPAPKPWQHEKVYMAQDKGCWFRCKVMKFTPLTVFFLDYGNMAEVSEIREVSEQIAQVPCIAVRLTFKEEQYNPRLEDEIVIKIIKQNEDTTYFVNVLKKKKTQKIKARYFFSVPTPLTLLKNDQTVVVIQVENGFFYLRTKECFQKLKEIEMIIEDFCRSAPQINSPKVDQLVLAPNTDDDKYYRAVITHIKDNKVDVKYLDYHRTATVDKNLLKNINEQLNSEPLTYFRARKLKGFENRDFNDKDKDLIQDIIKKRKKFAVVLDDEGNFDLFDRFLYLSQQLGQPKHCEEKVYLQDMTTYMPEFTTKTYLCGYYKSSNQFSLVPSDELESYIDSVLITEIKDHEIYTPSEGEICFCYYTDQWYRCLVTRILNDDFEVLLLDFGNVEIVKNEDLRKPDKNIKNVPMLALPCKLINVPHHPNLEELLEKLIIEGELYNVDVKSIDEGKYSVEIPSVYEQITKS